MSEFKGGVGRQRAGWRGAERGKNCEVGLCVLCSMFCAQQFPPTCDLDDDVVVQGAPDAAGAAVEEGSVTAKARNASKSYTFISPHCC